MIPIPVIILLICLAAIALRKVVRIAIPIWLIMTIGAALVLLLYQITLIHAALAINPEIMAYLLGVF